jgi:hypothetical protein
MEQNGAAEGGERATYSPAETRVRAGSYAVATGMEFQSQLGT